MPLIRKEKRIKMATIITNQATLNYRFGTATASTVSNITSAAIGGSTEIVKTSLNQSYRSNENITYIINVANSGSPIENITISDNLGSYTTNGNIYTPLTFSGNAQLFINGIENNNFEINETENGIEFVIDNIPTNGNAQIIYQATVNEYAPICCGGSITNTVISNCQCICGGTAEDSHTINAECYADVRISKSVCPNPIKCGEEITYIFDIYNYGNIDATDIVLTDTFTPPLTDIVVSLDGTVIPNTEYSYFNGVLTLPTVENEFEITVPAASCTRNTETGLYIVTPGHIQIIVTGNI